MGNPPLVSQGVMLETGEDGFQSVLNICTPIPPTAPHCEPGSSVSIATDCGLDGPAIESPWDEIFRPFRPALGPTQPPVQ